MLLTVVDRLLRAAAVTPAKAGGLKIDCALGFEVLNS
jgi:hypothetical protein